jgi:hypothetical protein
VLPCGARLSSSRTLSQSSGIGVRQIGMPARARRPKYRVVVDADDGADSDALAPLQLGEGAIEIGVCDADVGQHGVSLRAAEAVQPIAPRAWLEDHQSGPVRIYSVLGLDSVIR